MVTAVSNDDYRQAQPRNNPEDPESTLSVRVRLCEQVELSRRDQKALECVHGTGCHQL